MILKQGNEGDLIEDELRQSMTSAGDENSQLAAYNAQLNTHFDAAASRTKNARKWLLEVEPHRFTHDLIERIQGFMQPLVEHETHLESIKDGVADHNARIMHLFTATVSSMCIGPQWKKLKSEVDEVMGRSPYVFDDSSFEVSEEEEEEEEMREDEEEVESSAETPEERLARKRLELSAEDDDQSLSELRRSSRLAEVKTAQEKVSVKAKVRPKGSSATAKTKGGGTGSLAAAKTKGKGKESSAAAKTKGGGGKNKSSAKASKGEKRTKKAEQHGPVYNSSGSTETAAEKKRQRRGAAMRSMLGAACPGSPRLAQAVEVQDSPVYVSKKLKLHIDVD